MSTESNFIAPQGEMQMEFVTPSNFEARVRRTDIQLLNHGSNLGIVCGIIDLGTHMESFDGKSPEPKRKVKVMFEHPQLKQLFYEDDTELKSTISSFESTLSMNENSKVRKLVHAFENRAISDKEAYGYNLAKVLGARVNVQIEHAFGKKDPTKVYEKVVSVFSANGLAIPVPFEPEFKPLLFFIDKAGNNFLTKNFADLPFYFRKKIMESEEGMAHIALGGKFAENPRQDEQQAPAQAQQPQQQQSQNFANQQSPLAPSTGVKKLVLKDPSIPIANWIANGWTEDMIVSEGHGTYVVETPSTPTPPVAKAMPTPPAQQQAAAPSNALFADDEENDLPF